MLAHIFTIDTREQERIEGKGWRGIPGTGESLPCACCGKPHEVHALIAEQERDPERDTAMRKAWRTVRYLNYGVSCARKVADMRPASFTITRESGATYYAQQLAKVRAAA